MGVLPDERELEHAIVRHCAPTLAALKPASLFNVPGNYSRETGPDNGRRNLEEAVEGCARQLRGSGVAVRVLAWRGCGALVYVYRPHELAAHLRDPRAASLLADRGYDPASLEACLDALAARLERDAGRGAAGQRARPCPCEESGCARDFPHEMGLFLGYPYADVAGFIEHRGRDYLALGPWKVYADVDRALATFARFRRCAEAYLRAHRQGADLARLAVPSIG